MLIKQTHFPGGSNWSKIVIPFLAGIVVGAIGYRIFCLKTIGIISKTDIVEKEKGTTLTDDDKKLL